MPLLQSMTDLQQARGPDDEGVWAEGLVGFGHRRLSIIDLSRAGHQPMQLDDGRLVISFNGEVYNYVELRRELESAGHHFRSGTDTEVILKAYDHWGAACVDRFRGMWAFAIWDRERREVFCSRDPFGIKPFFYSTLGGTLAFASDIRALLLTHPEAREPDWAFLLRQMTARRYEREAETSFAHIRALPPAHNLIAGRNGIRIERYWQFSVDEARSAYDMRSPDATFRELLLDSIRLHFRSDVPVGVCLSGGLDSSSIVALASTELGTTLDTFSIVYPGTRFSEDEYVHEVNQRFGCRPHLSTPPGDADFLETLDAMVAAHGEPDQGIGVYSQWKVMELAAPHVTVLLDGQGGDELLAGYPFFYPTFLGMLLRRGRLLRALGEYKAYRPYARDDLGRMALKSGFPFVDDLLRGVRGNVSFDHDLAAVNPEIRAAGAAAAPPRFVPTSGDALSRHLQSTISSKLLQSLLYFEDRNSMAFSIEARVPFLDRRLVEFCLALPAEEHLRDGHTKSLLRRSLAADLPERIVRRRDKKGFPTPFSEWLRGGLMRGVRQILLDPRTIGRGVLDPQRVAERLDRHENGAADHAVEIFNWLVLETWFRRLHDQAPRPIATHRNRPLAAAHMTA